MNIFVYSRGGGAYRTGSALKCLLDSNKYGVSYIHYFSRKNFFIRAILKLVTVIETFFNLLFCDVVYFSIMTHGSMALKFAHLLHKTIITEFYLSLYDTDVRDRQLVPDNSRKARKLRDKDIYALKNSSRVIVLSHADIDYYSALFDLDPSVVQYEIIPLVTNQKRTAKLGFFHGNKDFMQLCWTGTYIPLQGLENVIRAMSYVKEKSKIPINLLLWGPETGQTKQGIYDLVQQLNLNDCVTFHNEWGNLIAWEDYVVNYCDLFIGAFGQSEKAKYVVPNKVVDGMSFKLPVITGPSTGVFEFCGGNDDIFIVNSNEPIAIAEQIIDISKMSIIDIQHRVDVAYKIYEDNFCMSAFDKRFMRMMNSFDLEC